MIQTARSKPSTQTEIALSVDNLVKSYGAVSVLKSVSVAIAPGDFLVLVGPSGCGKSTLLNCIAGLEDVTSGTIRIAGRDVTHLPPRDRDIAMVFQSYALYPTMNVRENIAFGMKLRRMDKERVAEKVGNVARMLQIEHLLDRRPAQLSGGQRQRVAMGRALVRDPALFLFDEPLSNLDAKLRVEMRAEIKRVHQMSAATIVYVTHDQIEAMTLATRIVVLKDGLVQQAGTPDDIYRRPANTFVADFMGSPPMNLLHATVHTEGLRFDGGDALPLSPLTAQLTQGRRVIVGIRPEDLLPQDGTGPALTVIPTMVENTGTDVYVTFRYGGNTAVARLPGRYAVPADRLSLTVAAADLHFFDIETGLRLD